jgi:hypothetical protein
MLLNQKKHIALFSFYIRWNQKNVVPLQPETPL